ncbi:MAG: flagellar protein FliS [Erythrobacter sp.]
MLHARLTPSQLYTRVDLDARIEGSSGTELTGICFDALIGALGRAAHAAGRGDRRDAVDGLARAASVLGSLQRSVDEQAEMGGVLIDFYGSISARLRDLMKQPDEQEVAALRVDVAEVAAAMIPKTASRQPTNALAGAP